MNKRTYTLACVAAISCSGMAYADGLTDVRVDPEVTPLPLPVSPIDGLYIGAMATKTEIGETVATVECVDDDELSNFPKCDEENIIRKLLNEETGVAGFVGYNASFGSFVVGPEFGSDGEFHTLDMKFGIAATANVHVYGFGGIADNSTDLEGVFSDLPEFFEDGSATYGVGVDYVSNEGLLLGARALRSDDLDATQIGLRFGYSFQ